MQPSAPAASVDALFEQESVEAIAGPEANR
jgi:hypothetical protein